VDARCEDDSSLTLLDLTAMFGHAEACGTSAELILRLLGSRICRYAEWLLENGAASDVNRQPAATLLTPLHHACAGQHARVAEILVRICSSSCGCNTAVLYAAVCMAWIVVA
jgi:ankyrin repeat protein